MPVCSAVYEILYKTETKWKRYQNVSQDKRSFTEGN